MKRILPILVCLLISFSSKATPPHFYPADNSLFRYTGRIDFSNEKLPRFWASGVYIEAAFEGKSCEIQLNDEMLYGKYHNYITVVIDDEQPQRIKLTGKTNALTITAKTNKKTHKILICKTTESGIGYLEFLGLKCEKLLPLAPAPSRKIEFIGNSITCGMGSDESVIKCDKGEWYDQHNAYLSYGAITARSLNAQWQLSSVSGIGLIHSCCNLTIKMPQVFDKIYMREDSIKWNFKNYVPDVVTVCLGQNDGIQDSATFCSAYVKFITQLRSHYPKATIVCLTSPMADEKLVAVLKNQLTSIVAAVKKSGDENIDSYFFSKRYHNGCGDHPDLEDHLQIANELTAYLKKLKKW
ncbi:SGNH/GDSL hydrolase family protein [Solitalea canadensis]|uniref:GDSL-like Lipase/Acylhydrolase n=1 Tax=Solitalea canadensis (strain ATCC 29591 / DSM 3403 / JCM 21819 / LMG 8368 / NBRC 15130 / NCIMB 12057 / USAM 9D) TaxID=929556 RepID=H8KUQ3_SOLCM|nr:SGNH/GDSL hydrolase family protein [Solitalea canadensis]AFD07537.1 GDSL-like Lipase/Acylhydrolase [Solitalea canadensis DSM 3403]